jgi:hypothetical protein
LDALLHPNHQVDCSNTSSIVSHEAPQQHLIDYALLSSSDGPWLNGFVRRLFRKKVGCVSCRIFLTKRQNQIPLRNFVVCIVMNIESKGFN